VLHTRSAGFLVVECIQLRHHSECFARRLFFVLARYSSMDRPPAARIAIGVLLFLTVTYLTWIATRTHEAVNLNRCPESTPAR
jgi:hypothetical protein